MKHATIVVTDGDQRASLATVRSLGRAGHAVHVCATRRRSLAAASRYAKSETRVPDPLLHPSEFVDAVAALADSVSADVVIPVTEGALLAVLPRRDRFAARIPFAGIEEFTRICDKREVLELASSHGIVVPAQHVVAQRASGTAAADRFPVVLKPSRSVIGEAGARSKTAVSYANGSEELRARLDELPSDAFPVLVQQRVMGTGTAISMLVWDGELRAAFAHRRIREKPPSGGVSTLRESVPLDEELLRRSLALLAEFHWQGVAMVEFKVEAATGTAYLMEINGRLWGSVQLAIDAGVDFPLLLVRAAMGEHDAPVTNYRAVRTRWEWGDVDHLLTRFRRGRSVLDLPRTAPGRIATLGGVLRSFVDGTRAEVFDIRDPRPFLRESINWLVSE